MTPAEIDRYTVETREELKGPTAAHRICGPRDILHPYEAGPPPAQTGPFTFVSAFMWSPEANAQKQAWTQLVTGMRLAAGEIYPDCPFAWQEFQIGKSDYVSQVLAQYYAKARRTIRGNLVFIEADVVCIKRCDPFEADFDIGIPDAKDKWAMMPFNPGVMFVKDTPGAQRFLDTTMEYASHIPGNFPVWYAYQLALGYTYMALKDAVNIKVFPHAEYNWSPDVYAPTDAYFVHLKGGRKAMQREYIVPIIEGKRGRLYVP
jgi:hypothetical protein